MSYSSHQNIAGFYCKPEIKPKQEETYTDKDENEILSILARYFISIGKYPKRVNTPCIYKILCTELSYHFRRYKFLFIKAAASYIERNQHHEFDLKDYKSQILKHTQQLIREQKGNK